MVIGVASSIPNIGSAKPFDLLGIPLIILRDKEKKIVSGNPEKIKKIYDTWVFSRDTKSNNPNWQLVDTLT